MQLYQGEAMLKTIDINHNTHDVYIYNARPSADDSGQKEKVGTGEAESMSLINQQNLSAD